MQIFKLLFYLHYNCLPDEILKQRALFNELSQYLQGKQLNDDDFVFQSERKGRVKGEQFSPASVSQKFNNLVQKLGIDKSVTGKLKEGERPKPKRIRLHDLRKYFRNNMRAEESFREFWMGHSLGVDAHYISRNPEEHRKRYVEGYKYLRLFQPSLETLGDVTLQLRRARAKLSSQRHCCKTRTDT